MSPEFVSIALGAVAVVVIVAAIYLIMVLARMKALIDRLEGTARYLESSRPKIDRILDDLEGELVELRGMSAKLNHIAGDAERVTTDVRHAVQPIIDEVSSLAGTIRYVRAAAAALQTGVSVWRRHRQSDGDETAAHMEAVEER